METILDALQGTPWWVYVLLVYLIIIGIQASKTRVVSILRLFILPILFTVLSLETLLTAVTPDFFAVSSWLGSVMVGVILGWWQISLWRIQTDRRHFLVRVPGNWSTLILILIIFATKYYFSYQLAVDPQLLDQTWFEFSMLAISGLCTGLFIGRLLCFLYRMKTGPQVDLMTEL